MNTFNKHFPEIEFLLRHYTHEFRANVQPYRHELRLKENSQYEFYVDDMMIRESLIEHVGMLPILATYFHGHITEEVNLGRVLELLAVHDIGEIVVGDEIVFTKDGGNEGDEEIEAALGLLAEQHQDAYLEFKAIETNEAKFAKSIDKIAPDIYDVLTNAEVTKKRIEHFTNKKPHEIPDLIRKHKSPYMQWSEFIRDFHDGLLMKLEEMFAPEPLS